MFLRPRDSGSRSIKLVVRRPPRGPLCLPLRTQDRYIPATEAFRLLPANLRLEYPKTRRRQHLLTTLTGHCPERPPATNPGLLFYIMVDSVAATVDAIVANGGEIAQPLGADAPEITARFRDPAGNVIGLYQQPA